ncbi:glycosyltransferase family 9 protein [Empedobacter brevis]|uniref:glycosyltransferase family 9 protein n=1 Tax=Empedobacter brevis TaxID=247 RepID=UPI0039AFAFE0
MSFKKSVNYFRRTIMRRLTGGIGEGNLPKIDNENPLILNRVLINRPNQRLGNILLITPLIQEIIRYNPNVKIDLFVKGKVAPIIFENYPQVDQIIELPKKPFKELIQYGKVWLKIKKNNYDLVINVDKNSSSGRLSTCFAKSNYKIFGNEFEMNSNQEIHIHQAQYPVYQFKKFLELSKNQEIDLNIPTLNIQLTEQESKKGVETLNQLIQDPSKKTLAFFTYATGIKCYNEEWWTEFYNLFYSKYSPEYNLIEILPVENISMLNHRLPTYYSKDVREIAAVMKSCEFVIAADSGMMHLSCAAPTRTIGLFKCKNFLARYKPYGEGNAVVLIDTEDKCSILQEMDNLLTKNTVSSHKTNLLLI